MRPRSERNDLVWTESRRGNVHEQDPHRHRHHAADDPDVPQPSTRVDLVDDCADLDAKQKVDHATDENEDASQLSDSLQHVRTMSTAESGQSVVNSSVAAISAGASSRAATA